MKKFTLILLGLFVLNGLSAIAVPKYFSSDNNNKKKNVKPYAPYQETIIVPQGQILGISIKEPLNINSISTGDNYSVMLKNDFIYNGKIIAQEGSNIVGMVTKVSTPQENELGYVLVKFTGIYTPNGLKIPISGLFKTNDKTGTIYTDKNGKINFNNEQGIIIMQPITFIPVEPQ